MDIASFPLRGSGARIPAFGLGTFRAEGTLCYDACLTALRAGYRLLDTAALYGNEDQVGAAVKQFLSEQSEVTRKDLFIVTKLHWDQHGGDTAAQRVDEALARLQMSYVDLFLMHSPKGGKVVETYKALQAVKASGKILALGVSNFGVEQLQGLLAHGVEVPAVNQIELHIWLHQTEVTSFCRQNGIVVMAYCPLARCQQFGKTPLSELATKLQVSEAALCNYWLMKNGFVTIPKSTSPERVVENLRSAAELKLTAADSIRLEQFNLNFECSLAVAAQRLPWSNVE